VIPSATIARIKNVADFICGLLLRLASVAASTGLGIQGHRGRSPRRAVERRPRADEPIAVDTEAIVSREAS
jgi:hypothetical protein